MNCIAIVMEDFTPYRSPKMVRRFLKTHKSMAQVPARMPHEIRDALIEWAEVSDQTVSRLICRICAEKVLAQRVRGTRKETVE